MSTSKAIIKLLREDAQIPEKGSESAAGYDLRATKEVIIKPLGRALIETGIAISVPPGTYGRIAPRSGLALKSGIDVGAGVIDYDYRGEVGVLLFNFGDTDFKVGKGERIAQLIFEKIESPVLIVDELDETNRGASGYGSSGKN